MTVPPDGIDVIARRLDQCDAALADKPHLALVFDAQWRAEFRNASLSGAQLVPPATYLLPMWSVDMPALFPPGVQERVEGGLSMLCGKMTVGERQALVKRLRGADPLAAEEELLAAHGFGWVFGPEAIIVPRLKHSEARPEFLVSYEGREFGVECRGLFDRKDIAQLTRRAVQSGKAVLFTGADPMGPGQTQRLTRAIRDKMQQARQHGWPIVLILTVYTRWLAVKAARRTIEDELGSQHPQAANEVLATCLVTWRRAEGVWLNQPALCETVLSGSTGHAIECALREAFPLA